MPPDGYAWWYIDGISADGARAISIIAFIGSVFSPWYRWSGRRDPANHICLNVATYGPGGRFSMTDRGRAALRQTETRLTLGPSSMRWESGRLVVEIDEWAAPPLPGALRGRVVLCPHAVTDRELALSPDGAHIWRPFAPVSDIEVDLEAPGWRWSGHGYFDGNFGTRALEADFDRWTWGRFPLRAGSACFYDATRRDGSQLQAALAFDRVGGVAEITPPQLTRFRRSGWGVAREVRADAGVHPRQVKSLLDAPFYARALVETQIGGEVSIGVHEALDLRRFRHPLLMPMLACRVPRRAGWRLTPPD